MISTLQNKMKKILKNIGIIIFWIFIWELLYLIVNKNIVIPSPYNVFINLTNLIKTKEFYISIINTFRSIIIGFFLALATGILTGIINLLIPWTKEIIKPIINIIRVTPVASFVILALVFMQTKNLPILVSFFMVLPLVWRNIIESFKSIDNNLIEMSNLFKVSKLSQIKNIYLPHSLPYLLAAVHTGFGYSWKSVITAEIIASSSITIGSYILDSKVYLDSVELFSWTIVVIVLSIITEKILFYLSNKIIFKINKNRGINIDYM